MYWLDLVRYADTIGYHSDNPRTVWPLPRLRHPRLQREQAVRPVHDRAARRRPAARTRRSSRRSPRPTTGCSRRPRRAARSRRSTEPKYVADRVRNASTVWLGATVGCAQCHDHKFDPYLAQGLLQLRGVLRGRAGKPVGRRASRTTCRSESRRPSSRRARAEIDARSQASCDRPRPSWRPRRRVGEARPGRGAWSGRRWSRSRRRPRTARCAADPGQRLLAHGHPARAASRRDETYTVTLKTALKDITAFRLEALTTTSCRSGGPGPRPRATSSSRSSRSRTAPVETIRLRNATASTPSHRRRAARSQPGGRDRRQTATPAGRCSRPIGASPPPVFETAEPRRTRRGDDAHRSCSTRTPFSRRTARPLPPVGDHGPRPVRRSRGREITKEILEIAAKPTRASAQRRSRRPRRPTTARSPRARSRCATSWRRGAAEEGARRPSIPQSLITTAGAAAGAHPAARQLAGRHRRGRRARRSRSSSASSTTGGRRATRLDLARWLRLEGQPAHRPRLREPAVEAVLRPGPLADAGRPRLAGRVADAPGAARLAGGRVHGERLGREAPGATARHRGTYRQTSHASPELQSSRSRTTGCSRGRRASASTPRWSATTRWPISGLLVEQDRRPERPAVPAAGLLGLPELPAPRVGRTTRARTCTAAGSTRTGSGRSRTRACWRSTRPTREECVAERTRVEHPAAGAGAAERPDVRRGRARLRRADHEGGRRRASRTALRWAYARALARPPRDAEADVLAELLRKHLAEYRPTPEAARRSGRWAGARCPGPRRRRSWRRGPRWRGRS